MSLRPDPRFQKPTDTLFVQGFNKSKTDERDVEDFFRNYDVRDVSYNPKGFAFVTFDSVDEAKRAQRRLDGRKLNGREIEIEFKNMDGGRRRDRNRSRSGSRSRRRVSRSRSDDRRRDRR
eukprot:TRINITY_DN37338_c0_g1_i1.p2 TRINITY_DN37338_c0_g1~~TRINITY_DN37338_c0_g1_i1.p2  ORF type:complete len:139 (+),score=27.39 TRINITY_DN37338_c0_g1_i1:58-417(+)